LTRFLFGLLLLAGMALGASPWLQGAVPSRPVGTWRVYEEQAGFTPAQPQLTAADAPVGVSVDLTTRGLASLPKGAAILTMTAAVDGRTVLATALDFAGAQGRDINPQTQEKVFHADAGVIESIEAGTYIFTFGKGDAEGVSMRSADVVLTHRGGVLDPRLQPIGFSLAAIGFIGLVLGFRHRAGGPPSNPNSQPPAPRWGRGGS
jgi:hypothetical protein